ncbi:DUF4147 domain-containing protein [Candidatus Peregrinibacteria bacterium]|nr:DUF4147 domain-containing protein [Candidatus Peregrinibacteria bacterium]
MKTLLDIATCVLKKIDPFLLVKEHLGHIDIGGYSNLYVVGAGKGAARMAEAVEEYFGDAIRDGCIIMPENEKTPNLASIQYTYATHPYPNKNGMEGAKKILEIANKAEKGDLIISLISGGGSALMCLPAEGVSLKEKIDTTTLLIKSGANINEINTVRKHISQIKGGFLAQALYPARCINIVISDVIGDDLSTIASGPLSPDETTFADALNVLDKYGLTDQVPQTVLRFLKEGKTETIKSGQGIFKGVDTTILANHQTVADFAKRCCDDNDVPNEILATDCSGECRDKAVEILKKVIDQGKVYIITGETTVTIKGKGMGGRNQEFVLSCLNEIDKNLKWEDFTVLAIGTDGVDGICPQKTAGAVGTKETLAKAKELGLSMEKFLENNDSYHFFEKTDGLIVTGPTGTNLGDLMLIRRK